jgi:hypothetical protein
LVETLEDLAGDLCRGEDDKELEEDVLGDHRRSLERHATPTTSNADAILSARRAR